LRDNPALVIELGERGRMQVKERYTWVRVAEQMRDVYFGLVPQTALVEEVA
jgi:glycosyltransferase involved in cell wall biosynthesis